MPKIIEHGRPHKPPPIWPVGHRMRCRECLCMWEIVRGDDFVATAERRPDGTRSVRMACPECATMNNDSVYGVVLPAGTIEDQR
jgi:hypothetical protein